MKHPFVLHDLATLGDRCDGLSWHPFYPGVDIHYLYHTESGGAAALLRYQPGASVPAHYHAGHEHIFVLAGSQTDENRTYTKGAVVINPPDTKHNVTSQEGCVVLVIWEKPVQLCQ